MEKVSFRFAVFQNRAQKNIDTYIINDITDDRAKRELYRLCHNIMTNVLADALYPDDVEYDLRISDDKTLGVILVGENIEYCIRCNKITISKDGRFRTYRGYGINCRKGMVYIVYKDRIISQKNFGLDTDSMDKYDVFDEVYEYIDRLILELKDGKIKDE